MAGSVTATLADGARVTAFFTGKGGPPETASTAASIGTLVTVTDPSFRTTAVTSTVHVGGTSETPAARAGACGWPFTAGAGGRTAGVSPTATRCTSTKAASV